MREFFPRCGVCFMNKQKVRFITVVSLILLLVAVLAFAAGAVIPRRAGAVGADSYAPNAIFAEGTGSARVTASEAAEGEPSYIQFTMPNGANVHFRRDLALQWYSAASAEGDTEITDPAAAANGEQHYFTMTFSFPSVTFETFTIEFQSDEENITKEEQSVNSLVFLKEENGDLTVKIKNAAQQELENSDGGLTSGTIPAENTAYDLTLTFAEAAGAEVGDFKIALSYDGTDCFSGNGKFTNIGGNYLEYRSSAATTPNTPITFTAELPEGAEAQRVLMKALNGQSFELQDGQVQDDTAPALVLNEKIYSFTLGKRFSLDYEAIDVCDDTVSVNRYYYMAKKNAEGTAYIAPDADEDHEYKTLTTSTFFMPVTDEAAGDPVEYVSIYFELSDGRTFDGNSEEDNAQKERERVYLTWYTQSPAQQDGFTYIPVDRNEEGPVYTGLTATAAGAGGASSSEEGGTNVQGGDYTTAVEAYQTALNEIAQDTSAGEGAYLYLPSLRGLVSSGHADYRNLSFTVCYYTAAHTAGSTASTASSLDYNELRIEVDEEGYYRIRIFATDASGNAMRYYDEDGELVDVTASNIWDIEGIPEFSCEIKYTGATIEAPEEQDYGYRDSTYNIEDFEIVALPGYVEDYTLYYFDQSRLAEGQEMPSYEDCVKNVNAYADRENGTYKDAMTEIAVYNDEITEDDEHWDDTDNAYRWDPDSSKSFVPQRSGIYFVELLVTDPARPGPAVRQYMAIEVRNPVDTIPGQTYWLQENVTAVVLFAISAVLAVVIVILFVVKPSDKKVKDVDIQKLKGSKKKQDKE